MVQVKGVGSMGVERGRSEKESKDEKGKER